MQVYIQNFMKMDLACFSIAKELCGVQETFVQRKRNTGVSSNNQHSIERVSQDKRGNSRVCLDGGKQFKKAFICRTCNVWLHIQVDETETCCNK